MKYLLKDEEYMDCAFTAVISSTCVKVEDAMSDDEEPTTHTTQIRAHKAILTARSEYFRALFRRDTFREGDHCIVNVDPQFSEKHVRFVLEYLYTNNIQGLRKQSTSELLVLLKLGDLWLLPGLKAKVENELTRAHITTRTVPRLYLVASTDRLREACIRFIKMNFMKIVDSAEMKSILAEFPDLCIPLLQATAEMIDVPHSPPSKKQRTRSPMDAPSSGIL